MPGACSVVRIPGAAVFGRISFRTWSMIWNMSRSRSPSGFSFTYRDAVFSVPAESPATVTIV